VALAIVLQDEEAGTIRDLHGWLKRHLAEYKMPTRWYRVDALPRNARGKISRKDVADFCARRESLDLQRILQSQ
jgi:acyl-coenzyme A synthetase/AMP-(fatty) acid ligase